MVDQPIVDGREPLRIDPRLGEACTDCGHWRVAYNSCRNRHCPKCQGAAACTWLAERETNLLPVGYFHVVFTLPADVAAIALQNKAVMSHDAITAVVSEIFARAPDWIRKDLESKDAFSRTRAEDARR